MNNRSQLKNKNRVVIKIGSSSLTYPTGKMNLNKMDKLTRQIADLKNQGKDVILVSSGAIAVGRDILGYDHKPVEVAEKQASAAVGQAALMRIYQKLFAEYNQKVAQILLTKDILDRDERITNAKNTFEALFQMGIIPIVNENDTVATYEIEFGDNDTLSAIVAKLTSADLLIVLSDIDGLYTEDPRINKEAKLIDTVTEITPEIERTAGGAGSDVGTGGMATKISAARIAMESSIDMVIANADDFNNIEYIIDGHEIGTLFTKQK